MRAKLLKVENKNLPIDWSPRLEESLVYLEQDKNMVASTTGFDWLISFSLIAN